MTTRNTHQLGLAVDERSLSVETAKQVSVSLENKPGRLAQVLTALAKEKVNITAMSVMDSHEHSVLRLVVSDVAKTVQVLNSLNARHAETDIVQVELKNQPGALAHVCELLAGEHVNIDYCYVSSGGRNGKVFGIFKVSNHDKAAKVLSGSTTNTPKRGQRRTIRDRRSYNAGTNSR
jgi:hypothetical protein